MSARMKWAEAHLRLRVYATDPGTPVLLSAFGSRARWMEALRLLLRRVDAKAITLAERDVVEAGVIEAKLCSEGRSCSSKLCLAGKRVLALRAVAKKKAKKGVRR